MKEQKMILDKFKKMVKKHGRRRLTIFFSEFRGSFEKMRFFLAVCRLFFAVRHVVLQCKGVISKLKSSDANGFLG